MIIHKNEPNCYEINVQIAQKTLEFVEECAYNGSQYTDIEELRRMSHESFGIKVSEPGTAGCGRSLYGLGTKNRVEHARVMSG